MTLLLPYEVWRDIKGYEGLYMVSARGRVVSIFNRQKTSRIYKTIKPEQTRLGYLRVALYSNTIRERVLMHRLVALHFSTQTGEEVNHLDGNKQNNNAYNLEWCTRGENVKHSFDKLHRVPYALGKKYGDSASSKAVNQYTLSGCFIREWSSMTEAAEKGGFSVCCISFACKGKIKYHRGFKWMYA